MDVPPIPYEDYETSTLHDDFMMSALHSLLQQKHPFLSFEYSPVHGCTYDVHLSHLKTHDFPYSLFSPFDVGGTSSNTSVKRYMIEAHYYRN